MTRFVTILSAAVLLGSQPGALAAQPSPDPGSGNNSATFDLCRYYMSLEDYASMNLGECMSFNNVSEPGFAPHDCDAFREFGLFEYFGFDSYSDCVRNY